MVLAAGYLQTKVLNLAPQCLTVVEMAAFVLAVGELMSDCQNKPSLKVCYNNRHSVHGTDPALPVYVSKHQTGDCMFSSVCQLTDNKLRSQSGSRKSSERWKLAEKQTLCIGQQSELVTGWNHEYKIIWHENNNHKIVVCMRHIIADGNGIMQESLFYCWVKEIDVWKWFWGVISFLGKAGSSVWRLKSEVYCSSSCPVVIVAKVGIINHTLPVGKIGVKWSIFVVLWPG